jgi:aromatic ring-opening dioxygenase LigB subunit
MPLVAAAMMPHGFTLVPPLSPEGEGVIETRRAMEEIGRRFAAAGVEAVVLVGPHGTRVDGAMCVMDVGRAAGTLSLDGAVAEMNIPCDRPLIAAIRKATQVDGIPVAAAGFGGNRADQSVAPLDWGGLVPLWFLGHDANVAGSGNVLSPSPAEESGPTVVLITPARALDRETMVAFGRTLGRVIAEDPRRIGFVASCDWAHTHAEDGPYGAHPKAAEVDAIVVEAVKANDLQSLISLPDEDVASAAIDGLWQTLILSGVQEVTPCEVDFLSYQVAGYYGMIVAGYAPADVT